MAVSYPEVSESVGHGVDQSKNENEKKNTKNAGEKIQINKRGEKVKLVWGTSDTAWRSRNRWEMEPKKQSEAMRPLCPKTICRQLAETELGFSFSFWPFCKFMSHRVDNLKNGLPTTTSSDPEIYALFDFNKKAYR